MPRRRFRRRELIIYRIITLLVIVVASVFVLKGVVALASDDMRRGVKKIGVNLVQSIYLSVSSNENHLFSYVATEETSEDTVFSSLAEGVAINHYAMHQGKTVIDEEEQMEVETEDEWIEFAQGNNEDTIPYNVDTAVIIDSDLSSQAEQENEAVMNDGNHSDTLEIQYAKGGVEMLPEYKETLVATQNGNKLNENAFSVRSYIKSQYDMSKLLNYDYLISNFYIVDSSTNTTNAIFDTEKLVNMDMSIKKTKKGPQILIYHTHASETYIDSKPGVEADTVVGAGNYLAELLEGYGYEVYHDKTAYDRKPNGESNRNYAYSTARPSIEKMLKENPSIQVVIDLHRDSGAKRLTTINGKDTAQIMLFNGLCRNQSGPIERLENPNLQANLAFSLQTALVGRKLYHGFLHKNYLKNYRYNMHLCERYLLIELGTANNTVMEAYNAMEPLANVLDRVLSAP